MLMAVQGNREYSQFPFPILGISISYTLIHERDRNAERKEWGSCIIHKEILYTDMSYKKLCTNTCH